MFEVDGRTWRRVAAVAVLSAAVLAAQSTAPIRFTDVTAAAGITWQQRDPGDLMGAGGAFLDFDGDGWQDVLLVGGTALPALYRNRGDGTFTDVTTQAQLVAVQRAFGMGAAIGDVDNDGDPDVMLCRHGPNALLLNNGDGTFVDATTPAFAGNGWTSGAAFGDFDGDGNLDVYVGNYILGLPRFPNHTPAPNRLLRGHGDGTFTDVTAECGVAGAGTTLAVSWSDHDGDGDLDLWVGNDFGAWIQRNRLYRNDGPAASGSGWVFTEIAKATGADAGIYCMGITGGDYDRDGDLDYYFSNLGRNVFLRNHGALGYEDVTTANGTELTFDATAGFPGEAPLLATSWGVGFHDFDLDGWLDLYVSNGHVPAYLANGTATPNTVFRHDGPSLTYSDVSAAAGVAHPGIGRGVCFADFDNDGDVDVLQSNVAAAPVLLRNDSMRANGRWLTLHPRGRLTTADAIGARIRVDAGRGEVHVREVQRGYSFESSSTTVVHFGFGAVGPLERLVVTWPSGVEHTWWAPPVDVALPLVEPCVTTVPAASTTPAAVRAGEELEATLMLRNHAPDAHAVVHAVELRHAGAVIWRQPPRSVTVGGHGASSERFARRVPPGLGAGGPDLGLVWSVADSAGAIDQFRATVRIRP